MFEQSNQSYHKDAVYQEAMASFQNGDWDGGLKALDEVVSAYPYATELNTLLKEMRMRSRIDDYELEENHLLRQRSIKRWGVRIGASIILLIFIIWGVGLYANWFMDQIASARTRVEEEVQVLELAAKFREAQELMLSGRPAEARLLYEQIAKEHPDYPGLQESFEQVDRMIDLEAKYLNAVQLSNLGDLTGALEILEEIQTEEPFYKDVPIRVNEIKEQFFLGDILEQAETNFNGESWVEAANHLETVRALDPMYEPERIEEMLFTAYMNIAVGALSDENSTLEALEFAEGYFRKALALRPQDPVIQQERELARQTFKERLFNSYLQAAEEVIAGKDDSLEALSLAEEYYRKALSLQPGDERVQLYRQLAQDYVEAIDYFSKAQWDEVIASLEYVVNTDPEYALGTARQTLLEAYVARGNEMLVMGNYEAALTDFQLSAVLAEQGEDPDLRVFETQANIANVMGLLGEYEQAVLVFRRVLESTGIATEVISQSNDLSTMLTQAERNVDWRNFKVAYRLYRDLADSTIALLPRVTIVVQEGEYITQLARRYHTTVDAINEANNLDYAKKITTGQQLIIPTQE